MQPVCTDNGNVKKIVCLFLAFLFPQGLISEFGSWCLSTSRDKSIWITPKCERFVFHWLPTMRCEWHDWCYGNV